MKGNKRPVGRLFFGLTLLVAVLPSPPRVALANHVPLTHTLDHDLVDYTPIGYYGPPDEAGGDPDALNESATIPNPPPQGAPPAVPGPNPSGKFVAYDTNVWESLNLPSRHPGDNCNSLPPDQQGGCEAGDLDIDTDGPQGYRGPSGGPAAAHGQCPASLNPVFGAWGECFNSQLEYLDYYEQSMETLLADFGGTVHRYPFQSPGTGSRGVLFDAAGGQAYNIGAVVPGADHPEETVLVSGHYDFTDSGPAAAWDSAEGHTEVMRIAYIMSQYWRETGTRPSATVKFIPWDSEESGTFGSIDYVNNNIPPGEEDKVRGYFNMDPCAGAYPAFKDGNFATRVPEVMQLADPAGFIDDPDNLPNDPNDRIKAFNAKAEDIVDQVLDRLDDRLTTPTGEVPIFVSDAEAAAGMDDRGPVGASQRGEIVTAVGGLALFSSDYRNFEAIGVPIFNLFPDYFGPHADGTPGNNEGISILHTPNDNLTRINRLTSGLATTSVGSVPDPTGLFASEGWAKGMEFCAQTEGWYMLQPEMAGAQTSNTAPVAYYEALPNEATQNEPVTFDASGTYQYADTATRALVPESELTYTWDFGDGNTLTGTGPAFKVVQHVYANTGTYQTKLTVTGRGGLTDTTGIIPVVVIGPPLPNPLSCTEPGLTVLTDPLNDVQVTGDPNSDDLERLSIAEPASLGAGKVMFTLKMAKLDPVNNGRSWNAVFVNNSTDPDTSFVVRMSTFPTGPPAFSVAPGTTVNPVVNPGTPADPASSFNADGTIKIIVNRSQIGNPAPGSLLTRFISRQRIHGGGADITPDNMPDSLVPEGVYVVFGSENCNVADLAITKTADKTRAAIGRNLTYTVTVTNNGPEPANGVIVTDTLPPNVTFVSASSSQGSCGPPSGGIVTCSLGTIGNGGSATVTIVIRPNPPPGLITNVASVTASTNDPVGGNNSASVTTQTCRLTTRPTTNCG